MVCDDFLSNSCLMIGRVLARNIGVKSLAYRGGTGARDHSPWRVPFVDEMNHSSVGGPLRTVMRLPI